MDRFGFIHEKLDIKILILFILRRLPDAIDGAVLSDLTLVDGGISYFDYAECLVELEETGHLKLSDGKYKITPKGDRNGEAIESSIPYSVRAKAERSTSALASVMRRNAMIGTAHTVNKDGSPIVSLTLSDGIGEILNLSFLASDEEQAGRIEENFRADAENYYHKIIALLMEKNG